MATLPASGGPAVDEQKVSGVNEALSAEWQLGKVERIRYDSKDGTPIEGWVVLPPEYWMRPGSTIAATLAPGNYRIFLRRLSD